MKKSYRYRPVEKRVSLRDFTKKNRKEGFHTRTKNFSRFIEKNIEEKKCFYLRKIISPMDREVVVQSSFESKPKKMLMFGSNNYLGLANHPYIRKKIHEECKLHGTGIGGPPLLNGYTSLVRNLEKRLAKFKGKEDAIVFPSGYATNLGIFSSLPSAHDIVLVDSHHHASCFDGLALGKIPYKVFPHNDLKALRKLLESEEVKAAQDIFVAVEGVYSMKGDVSPLLDLVELSNEFKFHLILDDAHGTGVMGKSGSGTADFFGVQDKIEVIMGTFSKTFAVSGGFVAGRKEVINFLRYFARSYVFSGSLSPSQAATVIAGLDLIEKDDELVKKLRENINYTKKKFEEIGVAVNGDSAIFTIKVPDGMDIRNVAYRFHELGIFVNAVEYPAVPKGQECFRISVTSSHTKKDIDKLFNALKEFYLADQVTIFG